MQWNVLFTSHTTLQMCKIIPLITTSDGYVFASAYLWGIVVSVWSTHRPRGGDGTGLTVSIRRPESRLLQSAGQRTHKHLSLTKSGWDNNRCANSEYTDRAAPNWTWGKPLSTVLSECINLSLKQQAVVLHWRTNKLYYYHCGRQRNAPQAGTSRRLSTCFLLRWLLNVCVFWEFFPWGCTHSPVLKFLAVDAHGSLVALGDTHLASAALNLLTGVLGGVHIWGENRKWDDHCGVLIASLFTLLSICLSAHHSAPAVSNPKSLRSVCSA